MGLRTFFSGVLARFVTVWILILLMSILVPVLLIAVLNNVGMGGPIIMGLILVGLTGIPAWRITKFTLKSKE